MGSTAAQQGLVASAVTVTSSQPLEPGQPITGTFTVKNVGADTAPGGWDDSVYLGTSTAYAPGDTLIERVTHSSTLAAGGTYQVLFSGYVPPVSSGPYYVIAVPDSADVVSTAYADTQAATPAVSVAPIPTLVPGKPVSTTVAWVRTSGIG